MQVTVEILPAQCVGTAAGMWWRHREGTMCNLTGIITLALARHGGQVDKRMETQM